MCARARVCVCARARVCWGRGWGGDVHACLFGCVHVRHVCMHACASVHVCVVCVHVCGCSVCVYGGGGGGGVIWIVGV